jgi:hypothetical protein
LASASAMCGASIAAMAVIAAAESAARRLITSDLSVIPDPPRIVVLCLVALNKHP